MTRPCSLSCIALIVAASVLAGGCAEGEFRPDVGSRGDGSTGDATGMDGAMSMDVARSDTPSNDAPRVDAPGVDTPLRDTIGTDLVSMPDVPAPIDIPTAPDVPVAVDVPPPPRDVPVVIDVPPPPPDVPVVIDVPPPPPDIVMPPTDTGGGTRGSLCLRDGDCVYSNSCCLMVGPIGVCSCRVPIIGACLPCT